MNAHSLAGKLTVIYGKLYHIKQKAIVAGDLDVRDLALDGMYQIDMITKEMANDLLTNDPTGAV